MTNGKNPNSNLVYIQTLIFQNQFRMETNIYWICPRWESSKVMLWAKLRHFSMFTKVYLFWNSVPYLDYLKRFELSRYEFQLWEISDISCFKIVCQRRRAQQQRTTALHWWTVVWIRFLFCHLICYFLRRRSKFYIPFLFPILSCP